MDTRIEKDPNFWNFCAMVWKDHPYIFVLLVILIWGGVGAIRNKTSFLEYWINGYTPRFLRKKKTHHKSIKEDQDNEQ